MTDAEKTNSIAQWAFDTRPVLSRFHLWLDDIQVDRARPGLVWASTFTPRGIARCLAMAAATTALGMRLFGGFGAGAGKDKAAFNQVKKSADAISAYVMSEGLWRLTGTLPENHAIMVCPGEGLMPKADKTPEMGANALLGFGRVYPRPEVARQVDREVHRLLNEPGRTFADFYAALRERGITLWGAAVDTLENTSRFAEGKASGPMAVFHIFDSPLTMGLPYESYRGCLTVPRVVAEAAQEASLLLDYRTPRKLVLEAVEATYPGIRREHVHVWTLRGKSRVARLGRLWEEWKALGVHLVEDGWKTPADLGVFTDSGTCAAIFLVGSWKDAAGAVHVFLCDGYAASGAHMAFPATGEILAPFQVGSFVADGMRGSHNMPLIPEKPNSRVSHFDGPPVASCTAFSVRGGMLTGPGDALDHPFWDQERGRVSEKAIEMSKQGLFGPAMLPWTELEYTGIAETLIAIDAGFHVRPAEALRRTGPAEGR